MRMPDDSNATSNRGITAFELLELELAFIRFQLWAMKRRWTA